VSSASMTVCSSRSVPAVSRVFARPQRSAMESLAVADGASRCRLRDALPRSAGLARYTVTSLAPTVRLPKGARHVAEVADNDSLIMWFVCLISAASKAFEKLTKIHVQSRHDPLQRSNADLLVAVLKF